MKKALLVIALIILGVFALLSINFLSYDQDDSGKLRPWQVTLHPDRSTEVFGLNLGKTGPKEALDKFFGEKKLALIRNKQNPGLIKLEAYLKKVNLSGITGKMVLVFSKEADFTDIALWQNQQKQSLNQNEEFIHLDLAELGELEFLSLSGITLAPNYNLNEKIINRTFGKAEEVIRTDPETAHYLYPRIGVDIALGAEGKDVIQYVLPEDFSKLRQPLLSFD